MVDIFSLKPYVGWVVRVVSDPEGFVKEGIFVGYDGPDYDPEETEDMILIHTKAKEGGYRDYVVYKQGEIAEFIPIRKATKEEYEA
ncbi:hypothetical protein [Helicobacter ailurogastricus]|uniref:hypothetical protein n=1 Tax=Helicobacter ailurogastricus TaxID=1578720 RepID=UPI00244D962C|nr:hypothetical protein [Helicobacter ailurogastricus]GMB92277.1 hypothetical protein NHP190009_14710 [Helicobacter ailurogastricus]